MKWDGSGPRGWAGFGQMGDTRYDLASMASTLFLTPDFETSLREVARTLRSARHRDPLAPVTLLLPNAESIAEVYALIGPSLAVRGVTFYHLSRYVLNRAGRPARDIAGYAARRLMRRALERLDGEGRIAPIAALQGMPGLDAVLLDWVNEGRAQGISPAAALSAAGSPLEEALAHVLAAYEAELAALDLTDVNGLVVEAAALLEEQPQHGPPGPLYVLGFDQFNPIQLRLLAALDGGGKAIRIYLPWDPARPAGSLALTRLAQSRAALESALNPVVEMVGGERFPGLLNHLHRSLFERPDPQPDLDGAVEGVEAPSREEEVRHALREIRVLLRAGAEPARIALLAPQPDHYRRLVLQVAEEYGVPVGCREPLDDNPAIVALRNLLHLGPEFGWRPVMEALRSPYVAQSWLDERQIDDLDRLTRERPVLGGRGQWRAAVSRVEPGDFAADEAEDLGTPLLASQRSAEELRAIEAGLMALFDHLTPPSRATHERYVRWLQEAILGPPEAGGESLDLALRAETGSRAARDARAIAALRELLQGMLQAVRRVPGQSRVTWGEFRSEIRVLLNSRGYEVAEGPLRLLPIEAARGRTFDALYVLGLSEGEIPRPPPPDPFFAPGRRAAHPLPLQRPDAADEASLWWQVIAACRERLVLLRPRLDEQAAPWPPSPFWEAVVEQIEAFTPHRASIAATLPPAAAASEREWLVGLAAAGRPGPDHLLLSRVVEHGVQVEATRASAGAPGPHEGVLASPEILAALQQRYGPARGWSVSRLNRYARCPAGFLAEKVLGLAPRPAPAAGMDPMQRGQLLHAILEECYRRLGAEGLPFHEDSRERAAVHLHDVCSDLFDRAPGRFGFQPGPLWRHEQSELRRMLAALVHEECSERNPGPFLAHRLEFRFGLAGSTVPRLVIERDGIQMEIHGVVDRVDRDPNGRRRVVDYKSGASPIPKRDVEAGLALQTPLYALAVEQLDEDGGPVVASYYFHLPNRKKGAEHRFAEGARGDPAVEQAIETALRHVSRVRSGLFPAAPARPHRQACGRSCDFSAFCRVTRQSIAAGRQVAAPEESSG